MGEARVTRQKKDGASASCPLRITNHGLRIPPHASEEGRGRRAGAGGMGRMGRGPRVTRHASRVRRRAGAWGSTPKASLGVAPGAGQHASCVTRQKRGRGRRAGAGGMGRMGRMRRMGRGGTRHASRVTRHKRAAGAAAGRRRMGRMGPMGRRTMRHASEEGPGLLLLALYGLRITDYGFRLTRQKRGVGAAPGLGAITRQKKDGASASCPLRITNDGLRIPPHASEEGRGRRAGAGYSGSPAVKKWRPM